MDENQKEIQRQHRQQQEKYVYYILALTVSAIGFAIYKTSGLPLKWSQVPLGLSVISWGVSIFCGLKFIKYVLSILYANNAYFEILNGQDPDLGNVPWKIEAGAKGVREAMKLNAITASKYLDWQSRLFYIGIVLFIIWHVSEMYLLSK